MGKNGIIIFIVLFLITAGVVGAGQYNNDSGEPVIPGNAAGVPDSEGTEGLAIESEQNAASGDTGDDASDDCQNYDWKQGDSTDNANSPKVKFSFGPPEKDDEHPGRQQMKRIMEEGCLKDEAVEGMRNALANQARAMERYHDAMDRVLQLREMAREQARDCDDNPGDPENKNMNCTQGSQGEQERAMKRIQGMERDNQQIRDQVRKKDQTCLDDDDDPVIPD